MAHEYFQGLPKPEKARAEVLFQRMADLGSIHNIEHFRNEGDGIYCFKPGRHRFPCFFHGTDVVVTHGFKKQSPKMPPHELERARHARADHLERAAARERRKK